MKDYDEVEQNVEQLENELEEVEEELEKEAERFAVGRSGRSARAAKQFIDKMIAAH